MNLSCEQISSNRKFQETYKPKVKRKANKEEEISFHRLLENEQNRLESANEK